MFHFLLLYSLLQLYYRSSVIYKTLLSIYFTFEFVLFIGTVKPFLREKARFQLSWLYQGIRLSIEFDISLISYQCILAFYRYYEH